jgi:heme-degrading monooxygenase HmoA
MYIAMNRFRVIKGSETDFEAMWRARESYLPDMRGFVSFHLLRGSPQEDHTLYSTHTTWETFADFEAWTKSEGFRAAHAKAGDPNRKVLHMGHPQFEGFQAVLTETSAKPIAAE